jgi:hypothetical protein
VSTSPAHRLRSALAASERGDFAPLEALSSAAASGTLARAVALGVASGRWLGGLGDRPAIDSARALIGERDAAPLVAESLVALSRGLRPSLEREPLVAVLDALESVAGDVHHAHAIERGRAFVRLLDGDRSCEEAFRESEARALSNGDSAGVVESAALRALALLLAGAEDEARTVARRASRMARTEGLRPPIYLANTVLARVRRAGGRAHLATRILTALAQPAPPLWSRWLSWELVMASGGAAPRDTLTGPARDLADALAFAAAGDRRAFDESLRRVEHATSACWPLARDARIARTAIDPESDPDPALAGFRSGADRDPPLGIDGLAGPLAEDDAFAWAARLPDGRSLRVLAPGVRLIPGARSIVPGQKTISRVRSALPALVLAGEPGLAEERLFAEVYGFTYVRELHRNPLNILIHRLRAELPDYAELDREDGVVRLLLRGAVVVPDGRCTVDLEARMLRYLATRGGTSAKEAAEALAIPLRSAQAALESLVTEGECLRERDGRHVGYRVEDTTFEELTR